MTQSTLPATTTQQITSLLTQLAKLAQHTTLSQVEEALAYPLLFAKAVTKARLDYTPASIERLSQLLSYINIKGYTLETLLSQAGSNHFFLTISAYLANYLAKTTDEPIVWLNYTEALTEINKKNREYGTDFTLQKDFDNSLIANIGEGMFCRPLQAVRAHLAGEGTIDTFITDMQTHIFERAFVDVADNPDSVPQRYLAKLRTGRVQDTTIGFFDYIKDITFDFSEESLQDLDTALAKIRQDFSLSQADYQEMLDEPRYQAFCYLLGFYLGVTTARLANRSVHWASFSHAQTMLRRTDFYYSIEHSFVMLSENHYHTPILSITNALFGLSDYPSPSEFLQHFNTAVSEEFAHPTAESLLWFPWEKHNSPMAEGMSAFAIPNSWQLAMMATGRLFAHDLLTIFDGGELSPNIYGVNLTTKKANIRSVSENMGNAGQLAELKAVEQLYQDLKANPQQLPFLVASYNSELNFSTGKINAIVVEIRVYQEPKLTLQLMLPYRHASTSEGFAIFAIAYHTQNQSQNQNAHPTQKILLGHLPTLINSIYQSLQKIPSPIHEGSFLDNYYLSTVSEGRAYSTQFALTHNRDKAPIFHTKEHMLAQQITIALLEPRVKSNPQSQPQSQYQIQPQLTQNSIIERPNISHAMPTDLEANVITPAIVANPTLADKLENQQVAEPQIDEPVNEPVITSVKNPLPMSIESDDTAFNANLTNDFNTDFNAVFNQELAEQIPPSPKSPTTAAAIPVTNLDNTQIKPTPIVVNQILVTTHATQPTTNPALTPTHYPTIAPMTAVPDGKAKAELMEKLRQDQLRLQNELSTSDDNKDKKLVYIGIAVVVMIILMLVMSKMMK